MSSPVTKQEAEYWASDVRFWWGEYMKYQMASIGFNEGASTDAYLNYAKASAMCELIGINPFENHQEGCPMKWNVSETKAEPEGDAEWSKDNG